MPDHVEDVAEDDDPFKVAGEAPAEPEEPDDWLHIVRPPDETAKTDGKWTTPLYRSYDPGSRLYRFRGVGRDPARVQVIAYQMDEDGYWLYIIEDEAHMHIEKWLRAQAF